MEFLSLFRKKVTKQTINEPVLEVTPLPVKTSSDLLMEAEAVALHEIVKTKLMLEFTQMGYTAEEIEQTEKAQAVFVARWKAAKVDLHATEYQSAFSKVNRRVGAEFPEAVRILNRREGDPNVFGLVLDVDNSIDALAALLIKA